MPVNPRVIPHINANQLCVDLKEPYGRVGLNHVSIFAATNHHYTIRLQILCIP